MPTLAAGRRLLHRQRDAPRHAARAAGRKVRGVRVCVLEESSVGRGEQVEWAKINAAEPRRGRIKGKAKTKALFNGQWEMQG